MFTYNLNNNKRDHIFEIKQSDNPQIKLLYIQ